MILVTQYHCGRPMEWLATVRKVRCVECHQRQEKRAGARVLPMVGARRVGTLDTDLMLTEEARKMMEEDPHGA